MSFIVIYDACVLYPAPVRDLLIRVALTRIVRARWSERILDECFDNIREHRPELSQESLARTRELMCDAVPDCLVTGFEELMAGLALPDADDRHVLAAGIRAGAQAIVTFNLKDFPGNVLTTYGIEAKHPDEFVLECIDLSPGTVVRILTEQAECLRNPPVRLPELLDTLRSQGLVQSVARLREIFSTGSGDLLLV